MQQHSGMTRSVFLFKASIRGHLCHIYILNTASILRSNFWSNQNPGHTRTRETRKSLIICRISNSKVSPSFGFSCYFRFNTERDSLFCCQVHNCCHCCSSVDGLCDDFVAIIRISTFSKLGLHSQSIWNPVLGYDQRETALTGPKVASSRSIRFYFLERMAEHFLF